MVDRAVTLEQGYSQVGSLTWPCRRAHDRTGAIRPRAGCRRRLVLEREGGIPRAEGGRELAVERPGPDLEQEVRAFRRPLHRLLLAEAFAEQRIDQRLHEGGGDRLACPPPVGVLGDQVTIPPEVAPLDLLREALATFRCEFSSPTCTASPRQLESSLCCRPKTTTWLAARECGRAVNRSATRRSKWWLPTMPTCHSVRLANRGALPPGHEGLLELAG
jgi:hypothetical protein